MSVVTLCCLCSADLLIFLCTAAACPAEFPRQSAGGFVKLTEDLAGLDLRNKMARRGKDEAPQPLLLQRCRTAGTAVFAPPAAA